MYCLKILQPVPTQICHAINVTGCQISDLWVYRADSVHIVRRVTQALVKTQPGVGASQLGQALSAPVDAEKHLTNVSLVQVARFQLALVANLISALNRDSES
ncbi:hypothetical protein PspLS_11390 [Pyricularia sp. CBS 133598]|nr:hypothetical protein PspLS_11390 [Pyricularia sp. CBS 133598]